VIITKAVTITTHRVLWQLLKGKLYEYSSL
jgi:hypothetical protein